MYIGIYIYQRLELRKSSNVVNVHQYERCHIPQDWITQILNIHAREVKTCHSPDTAERKKINLEQF